MDETTAAEAAPKEKPLADMNADELTQLAEKEEALHRERQKRLKALSAVLRTSKPE